MQGKHSVGFPKKNTVMVFCCDGKSVRHWQDLLYKPHPPYGKSMPFSLLFSSFHWFYLILQLSKSFSCLCAENDLVLTACQATRCLLILHKLYLLLRTENKDISIMLLRVFHICLEVSEWVKFHSLIIKPKILIKRKSQSTSGDSDLFFTLFLLNPVTITSS